jgi:hypothetical protein
MQPGERESRLRLQAGDLRHSPSGASPASPPMMPGLLRARPTSRDCRNPLHDLASQMPIAHSTPVVPFLPARKDRVGRQVKNTVTRRIHPVVILDGDWRHDSIHARHSDVAQFIETAAEAAPANS